MNIIEEKLKDLGITLSAPVKAAASYMPFVKLGSLLYISGQLPFKNSTLEAEVLGKLGEGVDVNQGKKIAELCAINLLTQVKDACEGDLMKVRKCIQLSIYVNSTTSFTEHSEVANGASQFIMNVFGEEKGRHSRLAIGVSGLPRGVAVEVAAIFETE